MAPPRHSGQRALIQFYFDAFNNTCATFQSAIRANRTLNSVVGNPSEYQHFWTVFVPTTVDNTLKNRERKSWRGEPGTSDYRAAYAKALLTARHLQSERDRVVNELRKLSNETGKVNSTAVKKTAAGTGDLTLSIHNAKSTHGNPDGICTRSGASC